MPASPLPASSDASLASPPGASPAALTMPAARPAQARPGRRPLWARLLGRLIEPWLGLKTEPEQLQHDPAQPVVTPRLMEQAILEVALGWVSAGLMENFDLFKETLDVYRDTSDRNRLNCVCHPDVVNQLRVFAALIQFKL